MAKRTWEPVELAILEAVHEAELADGGETEMSSRAVEAAGELSERRYYRTIRSLVDDGYLEAILMDDMGGGGSAIITGLRPLGRRAIGQWPSDSVDAFLAELDRRIASEPDPEKRSHWERLRAAARDVGVQAMGGLIAAAGAHGMGLS